VSADRGGTSPLMEKISQRTEAGCVVCVLAMVMGQPYTYERVLQDSKKYPKTKCRRPNHCLVERLSRVKG
jgi:hypothetical protein